MRVLRLIYLAFFFFLVNDLFGLEYKMILAGDPILEDLRYLSLESGKPFLSFITPIAPKELENYLDSIDPSLLSKAANEAFYRIQKRLLPEKTPLSFSNGNFSAFLSINSTLEGRLRFNTDIDWYPQYPKISPLVSFPISLFFADTLQLYIEPIITVAAPYYESAKTVGVNVPYNYDHLDATQPHRAFVAAGGSWWDFQLGRDRLFWGTGHTGSLSFSDNSPFYEYARLSFFSRVFKYSIIVNQMPLKITPDIYEGDLDSGDLFSRTTQRYFYLHRIDFSIRDVLSIGAMEGLMAGNSALEIRYLNPLMIFHSFFSGYDYETWPGSPDMGHMNGSFFSLEANWNIVKSLSVYGQFVMNEFAIPGVESENSSPNALGFMAGVNFTRSFDIWASSFFLEYLYTYPYLYMNSSPFSSFIQMCKVSASSDLRYYFTGYPRDTVALTLGAKFFRTDTLSIGGEFSWLSRGSHATRDIIWDWKMGSDAFNELTPSGTPENNYIVTLAAKWKPLSYLTLNGSIAGIFSRNNHNTGSDTAGGQASFSVSYHY